MGEPFERVLIDCVGPLPRTRSGNQFLLTMMCATTRYPKAIPLRTITAACVTKALLKFFSTFGLPKVIQSDQGTNFTSSLFKQVFSHLAVKHVTSSPYHPQSQGALERFHQTLKSMLRAYGMETQRDWDEGIPLVLFAIREVVQESVGFSPAEFVHTVCGPLKVLKDSLVLESDVSPLLTPNRSVLKYVSDFKSRLREACRIAQQRLEVTQGNMKGKYDQKAVKRELQEGDKVLVLLPVAGSSLSVRFAGPYTVKGRINDTNYILHTPDRRRKKRVCHINMLKRYVDRAESTCSSSEDVKQPVGLVTSVPPMDTEDEFGTDPGSDKLFIKSCV